MESSRKMGQVLQRGLSMTGIKKCFLKVKQKKSKEDAKVVLELSGAHRHVLDSPKWMFELGANV